MTKQNIIDLEAYRDVQQHVPEANLQPPVMSDELKEAIDSLINKLRSQEPSE